MVSIKGEFMDDMPHGHGVEIRADGWQYDGMF